MNSRNPHGVVVSPAPLTGSTVAAQQLLSTLSPMRNAVVWPAPSTRKVILRSLVVIGFDARRRAG
jgi:hypothetical protein